jgi:serine/threonine protein kinase
MDFALGSTDRLAKTSVRQLFNTISIDKVEFQLSGILNALLDAGIHHNDINPSSLLFSRAEKTLKLISFYWAHTIENPGILPQNLNCYYSTNDTASIIRLIDELNVLWRYYADH